MKTINTVNRINIDEEGLESLARELANKAEAGDIIALEGDLGTGKTTFTKAFAKALGVKENVSSPTFNIVKEYRSGKLPLYHFDVYRLSDGEELLDIGAEDYLDGDGVCVIEWADIVRDVLPDEVINISIEYAENEGCRNVYLERN